MRWWSPNRRNSRCLYRSRWFKFKDTRKLLGTRAHHITRSTRCNSKGFGFYNCEILSTAQGPSGAHNVNGPKDPSIFLAPGRKIISRPQVCSICEETLPGRVDHDAMNFLDGWYRYIQILDACHMPTCQWNSWSNSRAETSQPLPTSISELAADDGHPPVIDTEWRESFGTANLYSPWRGEDGAKWDVSLQNLTKNQNKPFIFIGFYRSQEEREVPSYKIVVLLFSLGVRKTPAQVSRGCFVWAGPRWPGCCCCVWSDALLHSLLLGRCRLYKINVRSVGDQLLCI